MEKTKEKPQPCPFCKGTDLFVGGVGVRCNSCLMEGPKSNGGRDDEHADWIDRETAVSYWNRLPR